MVSSALGGLPPPFLGASDAPPSRLHPRVALDGGEADAEQASCGGLGHTTFLDGFYDPETKIFGGVGFHGFHDPLRRPYGSMVMVFAVDGNKTS